MLKTTLVLSAIVFTMTAQAAAPVVYQVKTIIALMSDSKVIDALPGGYITEIKYRSDLSPFTYDIISRDYTTEKKCITQVVMKISNNDDWNPEYALNSVGRTSCK